MTLREYIREGGLFNENPTGRLDLRKYQDGCLLTFDSMTCRKAGLLPVRDGPYRRLRAGALSVDF